ncbi:hypothetical protein pneo_cds_1039 [Pandoravirus neocaledonia]|uniref:Swiss Army Knife RNA repair protein HAD domain-containing protein n=1 Tax=Pandoravirus neocaledonia TaxID=2107708 RepID=A0A2U7UDY5_9VIRU|nr:hypothetical protein pneo_cds_1039 [Pandoravirus neocaledonia]AVK76646.1 hypothetical protein pneo_cds_1039 [Pandoravirus neocaledonia]
MDSCQSHPICPDSAVLATTELDSTPSTTTKGPTKDPVDQLNIFDFDGTLFRSPEPNADKWTRASIATIKNGPKAKGLGWFQDVTTLCPPYVPEIPGGEWWNAPLLCRVRESMADPRSVTVLLTGRSESYRQRINAIVGSAALVFDAVGLKPPSGPSTIDYKTQFIADLIAKHAPRKVNMWDDRVEQIKGFVAFLTAEKESSGIDFEVHRVEIPPVYLADDVETKLLDLLMAKHGRVDLVARHDVAHETVS